MDHLKQIRAFVDSATRGSLSAAARLETVTPAVIGRRLDALEARLGVKLLLRTTRKLSLSFEGQAFLEDCQRILNDLANAEAAVSLGGIRASGHLRVSAPAGFGRRHVAPQVAAFMEANPDVSVRLDLSDRVVDLLKESVDCAVRIGEMADSSLVSSKLGEMRRVVVASPAYLARHGVPLIPADLSTHDCLSLDQQGGWALRDAVAGEVLQRKVSGTFECNDGAVLHEWALAGKGLAWRSVWEVGEDLRSGRLCSLLDDYAAPPVGIYAVFPQRRHLPLRVRLFIDQLKSTFGDRTYWGLGDG
ncbi:LysR family transcriptional regulator [Candidatus Accumulibacter sp. ACC003]|uniref:LysR family transcriptional regulator n=1 Tax=Candidatus Accumulibacter sp. ACC003 TaxID=2823334 RepID=UPI0025BD2475|nr:LysR family transcriptional regulator [Candidatus Accumulibacter sp. ACC003]